MIGRFYLKIGNISVKNVTAQQVYQFARQENRTTSFAGSDRVDRSALKYKVISKIGIISAADWATLYAAIKGISATCEFYDGATKITGKTMIIDLPQTPEPWYKYGDRTKGVYYTNVRLTMEEA